ncbi:NAD(P)-binding domain-containing protein [Streptomyces sp. SID5468]|nr:NAD(P)-binding domain-containing protein [Streptomyces sp. SID5468]
MPGAEHPRGEQLPAEEHRIAIIGTGMSGLGAAIRLRQAGITDFVVLERFHDVGGTWRDNRYPGAACDVPGHLYAYSFAPAPRWRSTLPKAEEIHTYLRDCVTDFGLEPHLRLNSPVDEARWDGTEMRWHIQAAGRRYLSRFLITATGLLSEPHVPELPGLGTFRGAVLHTARWDDTCDFDGKRVALIGTGASAVQCVPHLAASAAALDVYQRSPPWVLPRLQRPVTATERSLYRRSPVLRRLVRTAVYWLRESWLLCFAGPVHRAVSTCVAGLARAHMRRQIPERDLRRRLTPAYPLGCKRVLLSNDYYPALRRAGVELVTDPISEITDSSVVTRAGTARPADVIVLATGFRVDRPAIARRIVGQGRRRLSDAWSDGMAADRNIMVAGFPNMFLLLGPNSGLGHASLTLLLEAQLDYVLDCLARMSRRGLAQVEVLPETQRAYTARLHQYVQRTLWLPHLCRSWYLDPRNGHNTAVWPRSVRSYRAMTRRFSFDGHRVHTQDR